jgi:ATP-dependent DNA ligase
MQCFAYWLLKPAEQEALWKDDNSWVCQEKLNGVRAILHFIKGSGLYVHSRNIDSKTGRRTDFTDHLLFRDFVPGFDAVVDAEVVVRKPVDTRSYTTGGGITRSSLHSTTAVLRMELEASKRLQIEQNAPLIFYTFDAISWQGTDLRQKPLYERLVHLADFQTLVKLGPLNEWFAYLPIVFLDKKNFFNRTVQEGGEGVVLKNLNSSYEASTSRRRDGWVKVKKQVEFDAYVSGFERGKPGGEWKNKVGCLVFSVHTTEGEHVIARITNFPFHIRKRISFHDPVTDTVEMSPNAYGRVATVAGFEIAQRSFRLSHPRILRWKGELIPADCLYSWLDIEVPIWGSNRNFPLRIVR